LHHRRALCVIQIGELAGRAERRQPMHARLDEIVAEPRQHLAANLPVGVNRRNQIGKDAVEIGHGGESLGIELRTVGPIEATGSP